ncbi:MAG TPA: hypothetical protein VKL40_00825 [Candidatus Angelobacter sp.]|nr:hypothetical protein [Candidatus Angelobacter sp.]
MPTLLRSVLVLSLAASAAAAPREHSIFLGKWRTVKAPADSGETREIKIRRLMIDGRTREYTVGLAHDVTDRLFVVRRAYRVNDALPNDALGNDRPTVPQWVWRLGGWISVDRVTGHVAQLNLPEFDSETSQASWYRDYAAYCGASDDGAKAYLLVWQMGKRRPLLRKEFAGTGCAPPKWERAPSRVTFTVAGEKSSFVVRSRGADPQPESADDEGPQ